MARPGQGALHGLRQSVRASREPRPPGYVFAAPFGVRTPHFLNRAMTRIGKDLWAIRISITPSMRHYRYWTLGVLVGRRLHLINIALRP
jgi:hypothetical protein